MAMQPSMAVAICLRLCVRLRGGTFAECIDTAFSARRDNSVDTLVVWKVRQETKSVIQAACLDSCQWWFLKGSGKIADCCCCCCCCFGSKSRLPALGSQGADNGQGLVGLCFRYRRLPSVKLRRLRGGLGLERAADSYRDRGRREGTRKVSQRE